MNKRKPPIPWESYVRAVGAWKAWDGRFEHDDRDAGFVELLQAFEALRSPETDPDWCPACEGSVVLRRDGSLVVQWLQSDSGIPKEEHGPFIVMWGFARGFQCGAAGSDELVQQAREDARVATEAATGVLHRALGDRFKPGQK